MSNENIVDVIKAVQAESEATRDDAYPEDMPPPQQPNRAGSVVQSVRLPGDAYAEITEMSERTGVPVSALIRGWVLLGLAAEKRTTLKEAVDRLIADADQLRRLVNDQAA